MLKSTEITCDDIKFMFFLDVKRDIGKLKIEAENPFLLFIDINRVFYGAIAEGSASFVGRMFGGGKYEDLLW